MILSIVCNWRQWWWKIVFDELLINWDGVCDLEWKQIVLRYQHFHSLIVISDYFWTRNWIEDENWFGFGESCWCDCFNWLKEDVLMMKTSFGVVFHGSNLSISSERVDERFKGMDSEKRRRKGSIKRGSQTRPESIKNRFETATEVFLSFPQLLSLHLVDETWTCAQNFFLTHKFILLLLYLVSVSLFLQVT